MNRLARALIVAPATTVLILAGTTSGASAATGVPSGPPPAEGLGVWCVSTSGAKACFAAYGDIVWVKDTVANGDAAAGTIKEAPAPSSWGRECFNYRGKAGGWVKCDFDVPENSKGVLWAVNNPFIGNSSNTTIWTTII